MSAKTLLLVAVGVVGLVVVPSLGTERVWFGGTGGDYDWWVPTNWSPNGVPAANDALSIIQGLGAYPALIGGDDTLIVSGSGSLTMMGAVAAATAPSSQVTVLIGTGNGLITPSPGPGTLRLQGGAHFSVMGEYSAVGVGFDGATGTLIVTDPDSQVTAGTEIWVGGGSAQTGEGVGDVQVLNGGEIHATAITAGGHYGRGTIALSEQNSLLDVDTTCIIGKYPHDTPSSMTISGGAMLKAFGSGGLVIGDEGWGTVTVDGGGKAYASKAVVGYWGMGSLTIQNGGLVSTPYLRIADLPGSDGKVLVTGDQSSIVATDLIVASWGHGVLEVRSGGMVHAETVQLLNYVQPQGFWSVMVSGTGSQVDYNDYVLVDKGALVVEEGGKLKKNTPPGQLFDWRRVDRIGAEAMGSSAGSAAVIVRGATSAWDGGPDGALILNPYGLNDAILNIEDGASASFAQVFIGKGPDYQGYLTVTGANSSLVVHGPGPNGEHAHDIGHAISVGYDGGNSGGRLEISSGGRVTVEQGNVMIPGAGPAEGTVLVDGPDSILDVAGSLGIANNYNPTVGPAIGTLKVSDHASVKVGGNLTVGGGGPGGSGKILLMGGSTITIQGESLTLANQAKFLADTWWGDAGQIIFGGANLRIESQNPDDVAGLANTILVFAGGEGVTDEIEVCGGDTGAAWSSFLRNFLLGRIEVGSETAVGHVRLVDLAGNSGLPTEALYVRELVVRPGSSLDLGGRKVYTLRHTNEGEETPGEGGGVESIGSIEQLAARSANIRYFAPGGDVGQGRLTIADAVNVELASLLHQEAIQGSRVLLTADLPMTPAEAFQTIEGPPEESESYTFVNGQLTLQDAERNALLTAAFADMEVQDTGDGFFVGTALMDVSDSVWRDLFPPGYNGQVELTLTFTHPGGGGFNTSFTGLANLDLMPMPDPATALLLVVGAAAMWLRRRAR